ncbi:hypothetical protein K8Q94_00675 [Candidatus Nomurabacteria bacterium]|nr:hypothetical protein [Candidatus Nomurabacteria bacterium]
MTIGFKPDETPKNGNKSEYMSRIGFKRPDEEKVEEIRKQYADTKAEMSKMTSTEKLLYPDKYDILKIKLENLENQLKNNNK